MPAPDPVLDRLERRLARALAGPLPGVEAQLTMAPSPRPGWQPGRVPGGLRDAAALALIYSRGGTPHLLLTVRAADLPHHGGQISLPGGEVEPGESFEDAALREAEEEVGVDRGAVRLLGRLSAMHIPVSGYALHPIVGITDAAGAWAPHAREVARVLEAPLAELLDPSRRTVEPRRYEGRDYDVPYFDVEGEKVWGATAMVLAELLALLERE
ncbi:MAG: CoA pyrophosphatase [Acidobacteria bacterium]|nr:CoA pyrophosphatase [Acidobacteriota bacterium]